MTKPRIIEMDAPTIGGKIFLLHEKGMFVLEQGEGTIRTIACTHAGSGSLAVYDGVPDEHGYFPDGEMPEDHPDWSMCNGRLIYSATPVVMGSWMMDGGFRHGLTVHAAGGTASTCAVASIVWTKTPKREDPDIKIADKLEKYAKTLPASEKEAFLFTAAALRKSVNAKPQANN